MKILFLLTLILFTISCQPSPIDLPSSEPIRGHNIYSFERNGMETAIYNGQIVRHLLINDFKLKVEQLATSDAQAVDFADLYKYYDNNGVTLSDKVLTPSNLPLVFNHTNEIAGGRDLHSKATNTYATTFQNDITNWLQIIANNSKNPSKLGTYQVYIDEFTGYDLREFAYLTFLGGINYNHGLKAYFIGVENKENDELFLIDDVPATYTQMEHHWDETFGYLGAARNFTAFNIETVAGYEGDAVYQDNFVVDGLINFKDEYNFDFICEAARRDISAKEFTNYAQGLFLAFYQGRISIIAKDYETVLTHKKSIETQWEEVIAATAIHHLNATLQYMQEFKNGDFTNLNRFYQHWSAMYKWTEMLRYTYNNRLTNYEEILNEYYVTAAVPFPKAIKDDISKITTYQEQLIAARTFIGTTYHFADVNIKNW